MRLLHFFITLILITLFTTIKAQDVTEYKMEIGGNLGGAFYIGDVNNKLFHNMNIALGATHRFLINPRMAIKSNLTYSRISGDSKDVPKFYPLDPHSGTASTTPLSYHFNDGIIDLSTTYEVNFWPYGYQSGYQGFRRLTPYIQLGWGFTYGIKSKTFTPNIPIGLGIKYKLAQRLNLGIDWLIHYSYSDRLDGLSAPYSIKGIGLKNQDIYSNTLITLTYNISPRCINCNKD